MTFSEAIASAYAQVVLVICLFWTMKDFALFLALMSARNDLQRDALLLAMLTRVGVLVILVRQYQLVVTEILR